MKTQKVKTTLRPGILPVAALLVAAGALVPATANANTAANTTIRNIVTVNYADAASVAQPAISDEVDVTVTLVAATPTLNQPADQTIAPSSTATYNYTVTSNANGPDTYNLTTVVGTENNLSGSTANTSVASIALGATTVAVAPGNITADTPTPISVPADGTADGFINGINAGAGNNVVVIGGVRCDVTAIGGDVDTPLTGAIALASITVDCDADINPGVGAVIGQQRTFTMTVDPEGWTPPANGDVTVTTRARDAADAAAFATDDTLTTVEQLLVVTKYVRNLTTNLPAAGAGVDKIQVAGNWYGRGTVAVAGAPGDRLEYLVHIENTSGSNNATNVVISDPVPAFTTFRDDNDPAGDCSSSLAVIASNGTTVTTATAATDGDEGRATAGTVFLYPGDIVANNGSDAGTGGTIVASAQAYGRFCVSID